MDRNPAYRYYLKGLMVKMAGAIAVCMVYTLYYKEGADTNMFFRNSQSMVRLLFTEPGAYLRLLLGERGPQVYTYFDAYTGWPWMYRDFESFTVVRITSIFTFFGLGSFYTTTMLVAWFSYKGIWKLYMLFYELYPQYYKSFALGILFFPSLVFWGSGILKDTYSIMALSYFVWGFYHAFIKKEKIANNLITLIFSAIILFMVKPYILVAITPGALIWLSFNRIKRIQNPLWRWAVAPIFTVIFALLGLGILNVFGSYLGAYGSVDSIIRKAQVTQDDLTRGYAYSENYFDIGELDGTVGNFFSKAPVAIVAGIFRPFLWEVRNPLMLLSAIENTFLIFIVFLIFWRTGPVKAIKIGANEPMVIFSFLFAIFFAFAVGVTTANFGALVRLRIPLIPFFAGGLAILYHLSLELKKQKENDQPRSFAMMRK